MRTGGPEFLAAAPSSGRLGSEDSGSGLRCSVSPGSPWSYRIAGPSSSWPAVELYEAGTLLDVVSSTRLAACLVRGARRTRAGDGRALAWGRLPRAGDLPALEFSRGRVRTLGTSVTPIVMTGWCWIATAEGRYDAVTVRSADRVIRRRLRVSRQWR